MTVLPSGASICRPSIVRLGINSPLNCSSKSAICDSSQQSAISNQQFIRAFPGPDVFLELRAELHDVGLDRPGRGIREYTDRLALHVAGDRQQIIEVLEPSSSRRQPAHDAMNPAGPFAAGRALTA